MLDLAKRGILAQKKRGKKMVFTAPADLVERLKKMEMQERGGATQVPQATAQTGTDAMGPDRQPELL